MRGVPLLVTITNEKTVTYLPDKIAEILQIENAIERFEEARLVATKLLASGVGAMKSAIT